MHSYALLRDIVGSLKRPNMEARQFMHHPLLVMNGFSGDGMHLKLMTTMFQNLFPSINVNTVSPCLILSYLILQLTRCLRKTADAMRLPLPFYFMYFILLCTVIFAKNKISIYRVTNIHIMMISVRRMLKKFSHL